MSVTEAAAPARMGPLHPKRLAKMTAAIAGLTCSLSVLAGVIAARAAPHGLRGIAVSLHLAHQPLMVKVAAGITTVAVITAAASGLLHFYTWWKEHELD
jgi:hypothetical protein